LVKSLSENSDRLFYWWLTRGAEKGLLREKLLEFFP